MKLYSKHHIFITIIISASLTAFILLFGSRIFSRSQEKQIPQTQNEISIEQNNSEQQLDLPKTQISVEQEQNFSEQNSVTYTLDEQQNINVYEKCNEAVVNINTQVTGINWFLEPVVESGGSGSGSIIDSRGYVLTNVHVVSGASKIYISLFDGSQYEGQVVGLDTASDLAVLKFTVPEGKKLKTIDFGNSTSLKVGQKVIAIGNPFGLERTMTSGIVSGLGRPIQNSSNTIIRDMIQTDSAINPGNSGGPLLDTMGRMIGINTMIYSSSGNSAGVGFAVPSSTAKRVVNDLILYGTVQRGIIQAELIQMNNIIANYAGLDINYGVLVSQVIPGGNAEKAQLKGGTETVRYGTRNSKTFNLGGDIIVAIDGVRTSTLADYLSLLESKRPGETVKVTVHRNKKNQDLFVELVNDSK